MLSIASAAVQTRGGAYVVRLAAAFARLEEWLAAECNPLVLWVPVMLGAGVAGHFGLPGAAQWPAAPCAGLAGSELGAGAACCGPACCWRSASASPGLAPSESRHRGSSGLCSRTIEATVLEVELQAAQERYRLLLRPSGDDLPPHVRVSLRAAPPAGVQPGARVRPRATLRPPPRPSVPGSMRYAAG